MAFALGCAWGTSSAMAQDRPAAVAKAKLEGRIELSPLEDFAGLFVRVGSGDQCCLSDPEQEVWAEPRFELDLEGGREYQFEGIGIFLEPSEDELDASYYLLQPQQSFALKAAERARFDFATKLRPLDLEIEWPSWSLDRLDIEIRCVVGDVSFTSVQRWDLGWSRRGPESYRLWLPEGVRSTIALRPQYEDRQTVINPGFSVIEEVEPSQNKLALSLPKIQYYGAEVSISGASVGLKTARWSVGAPGEPAAIGPLPVGDSFRFASAPKGELQLEMQPGIIFEDDSATFMKSRIVTFEPSSSVNKIDYFLSPNHFDLTIRSALPLEKARLAMAQGLNPQDGNATQEFPLRRDDAASPYHRGRATLQLEMGDWTLSSVSADLRTGIAQRSYWSSNYQRWNLDWPATQSQEGQEVEIEGAVGLERARITLAPESASRLRWLELPQELQPRVLKGTLIEPGQDLRGTYVDDLRAQARLSDRHGVVEIMGRADHHYELSLQKQNGEVLGEALELEFGCAQRLDSAQGLHAGLASATEPGRCDRVEMRYESIEQSGWLTLNRSSAPPTPPITHEIWPPQGSGMRMVDVQNSAMPKEGSLVRVCMQHDLSLLDTVGALEDELVLAHRTLGEDPESIICAPGSEYLYPGWCAMPEVEPGALTPFLSQHEGCSWRCGLADARALTSLVILRRDPELRERVNCEAGDSLEFGAQGTQVIEPPAALAQAFESERAWGQQYTELLWWISGKDLDCLLEDFQSGYGHRRVVDSMSDVEVCKLRGMFKGYAETLERLLAQEQKAGKATPDLGVRASTEPENPAWSKLGKSRSTYKTHVLEQAR